MLKNGQIKAGETPSTGVIGGFLLLLVVGFFFYCMKDL